MYSFIKEDHKGNKAKGIERNVKKKINHKEYMNILFEKKTSEA